MRRSLSLSRNGILAGAGIDCVCGEAQDLRNRSGLDLPRPDHGVRAVRQRLGLPRLVLPRRARAVQSGMHDLLFLRGTAAAERRVAHRNRGLLLQHGAESQLPARRRAAQLVVRRHERHLPGGRRLQQLFERLRRVRERRSHRAQLPGQLVQQPAVPRRAHRQVRRHSGVRRRQPLLPAAGQPRAVAADVQRRADGHPFFQFIEALYASGITAGCGGGNYCPDSPLTRGQMAVFLAKALGLQWP